MNFVNEINRLKAEKNAIILGHYYQRPEIQDISDFIGDSLALAKMAMNTKADVIVFCGVHFMAETAKILNPKKTVLLPDLEAYCSLADSCKYEDLKAFKEKHPNAMVISYVNCSAAVKTISDLICTSGNALELIKKIPEEQEIIFAPDKNLGGYINRLLGRNMILWDGSCHVHNQLEAEKILLLKQKHPKAKLLAHPECTEPVLLLADFVGSTSAMLNFVKNDQHSSYIVATETGITHQMRKISPQSEFFVVSNDIECSCNDCEYMKLNTLEKLYLCLRDETPKIELSDEIIEKAQKPLLAMM
ncbi:MAG: quinolinate synthase NadA [Bacteroidales bacterium]|jgi:quinolinate synthase|nr:quinolinate synthase NadA [Bacteroidales bacterium]